MTGLPSGVEFDEEETWILGDLDTANPSSTTVTVTVTDPAGNPTILELTLPPVDRRDQSLRSFRYDPDTVALGDTAPALRAPTGAQGTLSYSATPATVCTVNAGTGALMLEGAGKCTVTATAAETDNYAATMTTTTVTVQPDLPTLVLTIDPIAGDDTVNIAEKAAGFTISGNTESDAGGTVADVPVTVTVGGTDLTTNSDTDGAWSVPVPGGASYITETSDAVAVSATKIGFNPSSPVRHTLRVDLSAPDSNGVRYVWPGTLDWQVGVAIAPLTPIVSATVTDIAGYSAPDLPPGLRIDSTAGVISGSPTTVNPNLVVIRVKVTDTAGNNSGDSGPQIRFPAVTKGDQVLMGFSYSPATVTTGDTAPILTPPDGARGALTYSFRPFNGVCWVDATSGAFSALGRGECIVTATAASTDGYNSAFVRFTVTVESEGTIVLSLDDIATDDTVNIVERQAGFTINGTTSFGLPDDKMVLADASVTVTVGGGPDLTATSDADGAWSVSVHGECGLHHGIERDRDGVGLEGRLRG